MSYLEKALKFLGKYYILAIPLYILAAVPALIAGAGTIGSAGNIMQMMRGLTDPTSLYQDPMALFNLLRPLIFAGSFAAFVGFILKFLAESATYGLINKVLEGDRADLNDFVPALRQNIVKYILYWLGTIVLAIICMIAIVILFVLVGILMAAVRPLGILLMVLVILAIIAAAVLLAVLTSLWFPAMVVDNLDVMAALRRSVEVAKTSFGTILGIILLVGLAGAITGGVLGVLGGIPLIGGLITSVVPAVTGFVTATFLMMVYRDKTGRNIG